MPCMQCNCVHNFMLGKTVLQCDTVRTISMYIAISLYSSPKVIQETLLDT